jgi:hypothetical protein
MPPDIHKLNCFTIRVGRIHMGHRELSNSSMGSRKAGLALTDAISDQAVNVPAEILDQLNDFLLAADVQAHRFQLLLSTMHSSYR